MESNIYQIDTFTDRMFAGNPAAVCPLNTWPNDECLQQIAMENNLAETAFYGKQEDGMYMIRWFTPAVEVDLCGHATLAAGYVLFHFENHPGDEVRFFSPRSGLLTVTQKQDELVLDFPTDVYKPVALTVDLTDCFDRKPLAAFKGKTDYMLVFESESQISRLVPRLDQIRKLCARGVIVTAKGDQVDFVSRFFAPQSGIDEDPVTGSSHTTLTPYWAQQLGKTTLSAVQLSSRRGFLRCKYLNERVEIGGKCQWYMKGVIHFDEC